MNRIVKLICKILSFIGFGISALLSLIFALLNLRIMFAGDFTAYSNPVAGFFNILFKIIMYGIFIFGTVFSYIYLIKKDKTKNILLFAIINASLFVSSLIFAFSNGLSFSLSIEGKLTLLLALALLLGIIANLIYMIIYFIEAIKENSSEEPIQNQ